MISEFLLGVYDDDDDDEDDDDDDKNNVFTGEDDGRADDASAQPGHRDLSWVVDSHSKRTAVHVLSVVQDHYLPVTYARHHRRTICWGYRKVRYRKQIARQHPCRKELWQGQAACQRGRPCKKFSSHLWFDHHAKSGCCFSSCVRARRRSRKLFKGRVKGRVWPPETRSSPRLSSYQIWSI